MDAFIRGGVGEVRLGDILPAQQKAASTREAKEAFAAQYEAANPNVLVIRDWEEVSDETIAWYVANGRDEQAAQALKDRAALEERRKSRQVNITPQRTLGMDPERAAKELRRVYVNIAGLDPNHKEYERLWTNWTEYANQLESICGLKLTQFKKGERPRRKDDTLSADLQTKLNKYASMHVRERKKFVAAAGVKDIDMLKAVLSFGIEPDATINDLIPERLVQVGAF